MLIGKYLKKYYKHYFWQILFGVLLLVVIDAVQLEIPNALGDIVAIFNGEVHVSDIFTSVLDISIKVLIISLCMFAGRVGYRLLIFRSSTGIALGLRQEMFEKTERLDVEYFHTVKTGTIMSWITQDTDEIQEYIGWGTVMLIDGVFMSIFVIIRMFLLDWVISLVIFIPVILIVIWGLFVEKFMSEKWLDRQAKFDQMYEFTQEK